MNLRDLEYLVALAEHRHFGAAAAACYVSQPTLSTQLKKLEGELGVPLIERRPRSVVLTPVGERIVAEARAILAGAAEIHSLARAASDPEAGTVTLGLFPTLAPYLLPHVVGALHARFPRLELLLVEEKSEVLVERLVLGTLDAALLARPVRAEGLLEVPLFAEDFVLAVPQGHRFASRSGSVEVAELSGEALLLLDEGHCLRDQALSVCTLVGATERRDFRATSLETLRQMVAAGVGITLLPRLATLSPVPESAAVAVVEFAPVAPRRELSAYLRPTNPAAPVLSELFATLVAALPPGVEPLG